MRAVAAAPAHRGHCDGAYVFMVKPVVCAAVGPVADVCVIEPVAGAGFGPWQPCHPVNPKSLPMRLGVLEPPPWHKSANACAHTCLRTPLHVHDNVNLQEPGM